jgi:hypothetical protein
MEGIFYNSHKKGFYLLRFYENGLVLDMSINELSSIDNINWFDKSNYKPIWGKGNYFINYTKLDFISHSSEDKAIYRGKILNEDEIYFEIESQITGDISIRSFKRLVDLPKSEQIVEKCICDEEYYPVILIPDSIEEIITREVTIFEVYKHLKIETPKAQELKLPRQPENYKYIEIEKPISFHINLLELIAEFPIAMLLIMFIIICLLRYKTGTYILFGSFSIFFLYKLWHLEKTKEIVKIDLSDAEYLSLIEDYKKKVQLVKAKNKEFEKAYFNELYIIDTKIQNQIGSIKQLIYYQYISPVCGVLEDRENIKRGRTESMFLKHLRRRFGNQILVNCLLDFPDINYQPDFVLRCEITGCHIDIEIDEPYSFPEKEPIHCIFEDDQRNQTFLGFGWFIIRFSEKQIIQCPEKCIDLIESVLLSIRNKVEIKPIDIEKDKKWTMREAYDMADNNIRDTYSTLLTY